MGHAALAFREVTEEPYGSGTERFGSGGSGTLRLDPAAPAPAGGGAGAAPGAADPEEADPDLVEKLGDEIVTLAAHIHAATHRFLVLIARFDRLEGWKRAGHRSCAYWLAFRTGLDLGTAREHVRVARALEHLPRTGRAMARGALSFSQVRALTRVAEASTEAELLELAEGSTAAQLERVVRAWKRGSRKDEAAWERERHLSRRLSVFPDDDGMYVVKGRLEPEVGALLMRALEAASDALYRERRVPGGGGDPGAGHDTDREAARRRADALGLLAERALAAGFGGAGCGLETGPNEGKAEAPEVGEAEGAEGGGKGPDAATAETRSGVGATKEGKRGCEREPGAACGPGCPASEVPISGTRAERYQVVLHVDAGTLSAEGEPGRSELEDGTRVSAETSRRLACDAGLLRVTHAPAAPDGSLTHAPDGSVLSVGRETRTIPPALRRALEVRDRGCRFPGCGLRFTDAHHVVHWAEGGQTSLENTVLLCRYHHRLVHEGGWGVEWWGKGRPAFHDPRGVVHFDAGWKPPAVPGDPTAALVRENRRRGAKPDGWTASARWKREADIPDEVLFRATEAAL